METTAYPTRAGLLASVCSILFLAFASVAVSQTTVAVRFANPSYDCATGQYCVDVEFKSSQQNAQLFGMNVRFFYDDNILEFLGFSDFQGGYGPFSPDPPIVATNGPAGPALFNFAGPAEFINGAIQLADTTNAITLDTVVWTKIFQVCFLIDNPGADLGNFCPSLVWDLEQNPENGGFLVGDDGVVITIVDPDPLVESSPVLENVVQFNWMYIGAGTPPYGQPAQTACITIDCAPMLSCAPDLTIQCLDSTDPLFTGFATATDICAGDPIIVHSDVTMAGSCPQEYKITRTWVATNDCNLTDTCVQTIMITDTTAPLLTCPMNLTFSCAEMVPLPKPNAIQASDNCQGPVTLTHGGDVITNQSCTNRYQIARTYVAADACGNTAFCVQTITVNDVIPPSISCPGNVLVTCAGQVPPVNTADVSVSDNCNGIPSVSHLGDVISNQTCVNRYTVTRTYQASDACGNSASCSQIITVFDNVPPSISCPGDVVIGLEDSSDPQFTGMATGSDNCGGAPLITSGDVTLEGSCATSYFIHRTWTAADACGNIATCTQVISIDGLCHVDLSLVKTLNVGQGNIMPGDNINFTITVTNQGDFAIGEINLIDYIPIGFTLNDPDWTAGIAGSTGQSASIMLTMSNGGLPSGGLLAGQNISVEITLAVNPDIPYGLYHNVAEITSVFDNLGNDISNNDVDSTPDQNDTNDPVTEDDHDPEAICILELPVILGDRFVCPGNVITYTVAGFNPDFTYMFDLSGGGAILGTTPSSITIVWDDQPGGPYMVSVTEIASPECQITASISVIIEGGEAIACIDKTNISIDNECGTVILSGMILTGDQAGNNTYQVFVIDMNGDTVPNATLTWEHVGQTFKVSIRSVCTGQSCWGFVTVEDKLPPVINCVCPAGAENEGCSINCLQLAQILDGNIPEQLRPEVLDNCGGATLEVVNVDLNYAACVNGFIRVTWIATDQSGNTSTCEQQFNIIPISLGDIQFPLDYAGQCLSNHDPAVTGWPHIGDLNLTDEAPVCNLYISYFDREFQLCGGGRKIIRNWSIQDWCGGRILQHSQTIKFEDHTGPVLTCPSDMEVGTDVWYCSANVVVNKPVATDQCSNITSYKLTATAGTVIQNGNTYVIQALPIGTHTAYWNVKDECGNSTTCSFKIKVVDNVPPVVTCHLHTVVSLTSERAHGITLAPAEVFDDGSFDNCGNVTFRARRMSSCIDVDWTTAGGCVDDTPGGIPAINAFDWGTAYGSCVPFSCCDVGDRNLMVQLEVTDEAGNVNFCMVQVEVQDKIAPELICPQEISVSCEFLFTVQPGVFTDATGNKNGALDEDPLSAVFGTMYDAYSHNLSDRKHIIINDPNNPQVTHPQDWGLDGWAKDMCQANLSVEVSVIDDCTGAGFPVDHPAGAVKLIERRFIGNDGVKSGSCMQRIWVIDYHRFYIQDVSCANTDPLDGVIWPCDVLLSSCPDDLGDTGEPIIQNDGCSVIGMTHEDARYDFAEGACYKILRTWKVLDWCQFNPNTGYGLWTYVQTIKVVDSEGAEFLDAPSGPISYCLSDPGISLPANNQAFLGENNPNSSSCSVHVNLGLHVREACSLSVLYDVKIYPFNGTEFIQMVPTTEAILDANHEAVIHFNTQESSIPLIALEGLPYNSSACNDFHRVVWTVEDGCGNRSYADYLFKLEDCKKPTPVCIDGLSTVIMPASGEVTIWAKDFNASSFDDCTPGSQLLFSFSGGVYQPSFTFTCDNVPAFGVELTEEIWAADAGVDQNCNGQIEWFERNKDFCTTSIVITDNNNVCENQGGVLDGGIVTEHSDAVGNVIIKLSNPENTLPEFITGQDGKFNFSHVPAGTSYTLTSERTDNCRNGVSTLDLVKIQKHLLGQEVFTSPYQYIAADANNSKSVSAIDLIEIRKLILGLQDQFPVNQSWRFVPKGTEMAPGNPWPYNEQIEIPQVGNGPATGFDFVGVKIGDVNNSVQANAAQILPRASKRPINIMATGHGKIEAGEEFEVELEFPEVVSGFQWTMETTGLEYEGVSSDDIQITDQNVGLLGNGVVTMSWNGDLTEKGSQSGMSLTLKFKVIQSGRLINMMDLSSRIATAEAYTSKGEILDVNLTFNSSSVFTDFALYQNKPNPWSNQTIIGFYLPADAPATFTIYDVEGKVLKTIYNQYKAGYNSIILSDRDIPSAGVLYYRLDSGAYSASKKMVVIH